jgi:hypothetical protein
MASVRQGIIDAQMDLNDTRLRVRLDRIEPELRVRLYRTIGRLTKELLHKVEAREPIRTGRLRRLTEAYVDDNKIKNFVRGRVRVLRTREHNTAAAAGALEYGSTGKEFPVSAYSRGRTRRRHAVRWYTRVGGITEMRFLRGPAAAMLPKARQEIARVLHEVVSE